MFLLNRKNNNFIVPDLQEKLMRSNRCVVITYDWAGVYREEKNNVGIPSTIYHLMTDDNWYEKFIINKEGVKKCI